MSCSISCKTELADAWRLHDKYRLGSDLFQRAASAIDQYRYRPLPASSSPLASFPVSSLVQVERYKVMVENMKRVALSDQELTIEERNLCCV